MRFTLLWGVIVSPFAGTILALIAARSKRWWLVVTVIWLAIIAFVWWDLIHYPPEL
jgi:hypothetical protein